MASKLSKYDPAITPVLAGHLAARGLIDAQIAELLQVADRTFDTWLRRYPELRESMKPGKDFVNALVEGSLLKRALGFDVEEVTREKVPAGKQRADGTPRMRFAVTKRVRKHVAPDTLALIYWLNNRKPDEWKQRNHVLVKTERPFEEMSDSELRAIAETANGSSAGNN